MLRRSALDHRILQLLDRKSIEGRIFQPEFIKVHRQDPRFTVVIDLDNTLRIGRFLPEEQYWKAGGRIRRGAKELFDALKRQGYKLVLWTATTRASLEQTLLAEGALWLPKAVDLVITYENFATVTDNLTGLTPDDLCRERERMAISGLSAAYAFFLSSPPDHPRKNPAFLFGRRRSVIIEDGPWILNEAKEGGFNAILLADFHAGRPEPVFTPQLIRSIIAAVEAVRVANLSLSPRQAEVAEEIASLTRKLGVTPTQPVDELVFRQEALGRTFLSALAADEAGRDVFFKTILKQDDQSRRLLVREATFLMQAEPINRVVRSFHIPELFRADVVADRPWLVRRAYEAEELHQAYQVDGDWAGLVSLVRELDRLPPDLLVPLPAGYHPYNREYFDTPLSFADPDVSRAFPQFAALTGILSRHLDRVSTADHLLGFTHGDLHPSNILRDGPKGLILIDWDHVGRGPRGYDMAKIWSNLWQQPEVQEGLLDDFFSAVEQRGALRRNVLTFCLLHVWNEIHYCLELRMGKKPDLFHFLPTLDQRLARHWDAVEKLMERLSQDDDSRH